MILFQYILLHSFLIIVLLYTGIRISKGRDYWMYAAIGITAFVVVEGLRWGRNIDWCVYSFAVYDEYLAGRTTDHEILFQLIWRLFADLGMPYYLVISFCSGLLAFSVYFLFEPHKKVAPIAIPFAFLVFSLFAENVIRWYMALSFIFIGTRYITEKKYKSGVFWVFVGIMCHYGTIIIAPIFLFLLTRKRIISKPIFAILITCMICVVMSGDLLIRVITPFFGILSQFTRFSDYIEDIDRLTGNVVGSEAKSPLVMILTLLPLFGFVVISYALCKKDKKMIPFYNVLVFGIYFKAAGNGFELFGRYSCPFEPYTCLMGAYAIYYIKDHLRHNLLNLLMLGLCLFYIGRKIQVYITPMDSEDFMKYAWNKDLKAPIYLYNLWEADKR